MSPASAPPGARAPLPPDVVRLEGIAVEAPIGVYAHERGILQRLEIDIAVETDIREAARTDDLRHAVDYDRLAAVAREVATVQHHALIETVAESIARRVLETLGPRSSRVFVRIKKPSAVPGALGPAVEIWREGTTA